MRRWGNGWDDGSCVVRRSVSVPRTTPAGDSAIPGFRPIPWVAGTVNSDSPTWEDSLHQAGWGSPAGRAVPGARGWRASVAPAWSVGSGTLVFGSVTAPHGCVRSDAAGRVSRLLGVAWPRCVDSAGDRCPKTRCRCWHASSRPSRSLRSASPSAGPVVLSPSRPGWRPRAASSRRGSHASMFQLGRSPRRSARASRLLPRDRPTRLRGPDLPRQRQPRPQRSLLRQPPPWAPAARRSRLKELWIERPASLPTVRRADPFVICAVRLLGWICSRMSVSRSPARPFHGQDARPVARSRPS